MIIPTLPSVANVSSHWMKCLRSYFKVRYGWDFMKEDDSEESSGSEMEGWRKKVLPNGKTYGQSDTIDRMVYGVEGRAWEVELWRQVGIIPRNKYPFINRRVWSLPPEISQACQITIHILHPVFLNPPIIPFHSIPCQIHPLKRKIPKRLKIEHGTDLKQSGTLYTIGWANSIHQTT